MHPGQKLKPGARVLFERDGVRLHGEVLARHFFGRRTIRLWTDDGSSVTRAIDRIGHIPLPPYIKREDRAVGSRAISDGLRARAWIGRRADRRPAFHRRAARRARGARRRARPRSRCTSATARSSPCASERVEDHVVDPETFTVSPDCRRCADARAARRPPRHRRRDDDRAGAGVAGGIRRRHGANRASGQTGCSSTPATRSGSSAA